MQNPMGRDQRTRTPLRRVIPAKKAQAKGRWEKPKEKKGEDRDGQNRT